MRILRRKPVVVMGIALSLGQPVLAQSSESSVIYPSQGQTAATQEQETAECRQWAQNNTGVNPEAIAAAQTSEAPATTAPEQETGPQGERLKGGARGAIGGAVIGEIADDDASKGAGIGAAAGAMAGGARQRNAQKEQEDKAQEQQAEAQERQQRATEDLARYRQAFGACMEGRGYVVK